MAPEVPSHLQRPERRQLHPRREGHPPEVEDDLAVKRGVGPVHQPPTAFGRGQRESQDGADLLHGPPEWVLLRLGVEEGSEVRGAQERGRGGEKPLREDPEGQESAQVK